VKDEIIPVLKRHALEDVWRSSTKPQCYHNVGTRYIRVVSFAFLSLWPSEIILVLTG